MDWMLLVFSRPAPFSTTGPGQGTLAPQLHTPAPARPRALGSVNRSLACPSVHPSISFLLPPLDSSRLDINHRQPPPSSPGLPPLPPLPLPPTSHVTRPRRPFRGTQHSSPTPEQQTTSVARHPYKYEQHPFVHTSSRTVDWTSRTAPAPATDNAFACTLNES